MKKLLTCFIILTFIALGWPPLAKAQEDGSLRLSTSPMPVNLSTVPNSTVTTELRVRNSGSKTETLQVGLLKFTANEQTGQAELSSRQAGDDYFDWVSFSPSRLTLAPNEWGTTKMTIQVPASAAFGYYYAVTFSRAAADTPKPGTASLVGAAATLVLLEVKVPGAKREIQLESFDTTQSWYEFLPVTFLVKLRNTGNVHAAPFGNIFIEQRGKQIDSIAVNESRGNILPQSPRTYTVDWSNGFPVYEDKTQDDSVVLSNNGQAKTSLHWDFSKVNSFRFGKYTAHLVLAYDNGSRDVSIERSVDFWVIPWRLMLISLAIGVFFIFGVYMFGRGIWNKARHRT